MYCYQWKLWRWIQPKLALCFLNITPCPAPSASLLAFRLPTGRAKCSRRGWGGQGEVWRAKPIFRPKGRDYVTALEVKSVVKWKSCKERRFYSVFSIKSAQLSIENRKTQNTKNTEMKNNIGCPKNSTKHQKRQKQTQTGNTKPKHTKPKKTITPRNLKKPKQTNKQQPQNTKP